MLRKLLIVPVLLFVILFAATLLQPAEVRVERSRQMPVERAVVFAELSDFERWAAWSPWERLDPHMKKQYAGRPGTPGSSYAWQGNEKVGTGRMTLESIEAPERLEIELAFFEPWEATNKTRFTLVPEGQGTRVTWTMIATHDFMGKLFSLFMDMDAMVGPDFERGLAQLESVARARHEAAIVPSHIRRP